MTTYTALQLQDKLLTHGRTLPDAERNILFFNWSASGVEFNFEGTALLAEFYADFAEEIDGNPADPNAPRRPTWPWVALFVDGADTPCRHFELRPDCAAQLLFCAETPEKHTFRLVKMTENCKTFLGLRALKLEGELLPPPAANHHRIEFVGDSITCGYGNSTPERDRGFYSAEENGWMAHGAQAARLLGMEYSAVSVSGIMVSRRKELPRPYDMDMLYQYTDRPQQEKLNPAAPLILWDFAAHPSEAVVINLGTNDGFTIAFGNDPAELDAFEQDYIAFIKQVRAANGPNARIVCALGSMNYYVYDNILNAVNQYRKESGDENIYTFKYTMLMDMLDGIGAAGHPSLATHGKMAREIAAFLKDLLA